MVERVTIALLSFYLGYSLFFTLVVAPAIFKTLGPQMGGKVVETIFPYYFAASVSFLGLSTLLLLKQNLRKWALVLLIATLMAAFQEFYLLPKALELKVNSPEESKFWHKISVLLNLAEIAISAFVLGALLFKGEKEEEKNL
jgi:hypothetical protein